LSSGRMPEPTYPTCPECPEGFNELWYAELVFGMTCHVCFFVASCKVNLTHTQFCGRVPEIPLECFVLRIRTCAVCLKCDTRCVSLRGSMHHLSFSDSYPCMALQLYGRDSTPSLKKQAVSSRNGCRLLIVRLSKSQRKVMS